jgi:hypothetical protein
VSAIRTADFRLVFYGGEEGGELYDHRDDPGEIANRWDDPAYAAVRLELVERLLAFTQGYRTNTEFADDQRLDREQQCSPTRLLHKGRRYWSRLLAAYRDPVSWPPPDPE